MRRSSLVLLGLRLFGYVYSCCYGKTAKEFLVDTIGMLGILLLAKQRGIIDGVKPDVDKLRKNGYRISEKLYRQILADNGEIDCIKDDKILGGYIKLQKTLILLSGAGGSGIGSVIVIVKMISIIYPP